MRDKVSIIIPVYNSEDSINRCVNSIEENTYENYEVILIEDCSSDRSFETCKKLERKYDNIVCIQNSMNRGVSYTRNQGLKKASGKYLMFVDSDDWVEKDYVETFVNTIIKEQTNLVISGYVNHDEVQNGRTDIFGFPDIDTSRKIDYKECLEKLYEDRLIQILWNKIFLMDIVKENEIYFDETISIGEDFRFVLKYIEKMRQPEIILLDRPLYHYMRDNPNSLMSAAKLANIDEILVNLRMMKELLGEKKEKIEAELIQEREQQVQLYAYFIYRNSVYTKQEKKELLQQLDPKKWKGLYRRNRELVMKEKISGIVRRR